MNGECVLTTPISISIAQKITSDYRALIKSSIRRRVVYSFVSLLLFMISPDCAQGGGSNQDRVHHPVWDLRLQNYVFWSEKCRSNLYRCGARSGVLMKCVTKEDGYNILREIHEGVCGNHAASKMLVGKAYRAGFWWPTAVSDAEDLVRRCQNCQFFGKQSHVPANSLITIPPSWPFDCWSLDMIVPFHNGVRLLHPCVGGYRQVYQVDRVQADSQAHTRSSC
jgi:hypothetical protein